MDITPASRSLYNRLARGWNTWDVNSVTAHVLLPDRLNGRVVATTEAGSRRVRFT
jgi:hypothetical protein